MAVKKFKPVTPGSRNHVGNSFAEVTTNQPEKSLLISISKTGGRNNQGRRSMRYIGGGHKKRFRLIDFMRNKAGVPATVKTIEYDPNRTAFIALVSYADGEKRYILAPKDLKVGQTVVSGEKVAPDMGNALPLMNMPVGTIVHNIEIHPGRGGQLVRAAGTSAQLVAKEGKYAIIKMPSGETRMILGACYATVGVVSNSDNSLTNMGKAGRNRWKGTRPRTRGVAMNPVDHPMGGGEGRSSGGHPRSRTGLLAKGKKTRDPKKYSNKHIISRPKKK